MKKFGQVWVETVVYTLIGLSVIGILLAVARPKIDEMKDGFIIEQTIDSLNQIDAKIYEVQRVSGNSRVLDLKVSKGKLVIDSENNVLSWILDSTKKYSEEGAIIDIGRLTVLTEKGNPWRINISSKYSVDLKYDDKDDLKELSEANAKYFLTIRNLGNDVVNLKVR